MTTFLGNEGNASAGRASAHVLIRQVTLSVLVPVLDLFSPSPQSTGGRSSSIHGTGIPKMCDRPKPRNSTLTKKKDQL